MAGCRAGYQASLAGFVWYQLQKMAMATRNPEPSNDKPELQEEASEAASISATELFHRVPRPRQPSDMSTP